MNKGQLLSHFVSLSTVLFCMGRKMDMICFYSLNSTPPSPPPVFRNKACNSKLKRTAPLPILEYIPLFTDWHIHIQMKVGLKRSFQFRSCPVHCYNELISSITLWSRNLDTFDSTGSCIQNLSLSKSNNLLVTAFMAGLQQFDLNASVSPKDGWFLFSPVWIPLPSIHAFPGSNYISHQTLPEAAPFHTQEWLPGSFQQPLSASPTILLHTG